MSPDDARQHSPAADRNKEPILAVLKRMLPSRGTALEIASGTGQHVVHFAAGLPDWSWQPSDPDPDAIASIAAWAAHAGLANVRPPIRLDVADPQWPILLPDAIYCANMLHIAAWTTCAGLMRGAARQLTPQGLLIIYGPFLIAGEPVAPSNLAFDADLRARNPAWGLRKLDDVVDVARAAGLVLRERVAMPANNQTLVFARDGNRVPS